MDWDWWISQTIIGLTLGGVYALIALGYSLVYGVLRLINFAHGDVYMVGAVVAYWVAKGFFGWTETADHLIPIWAIAGMLAISIASCVSLGYIIERFAYRPLRRAPRLNSLITAIGVSFLLENIFQLQAFFGAAPRGFPYTNLNKTVSIGGHDVGYESLMILCGTAFFLIACRWIILHTRMGLGIRATSFNHDYARLMGINVNAITAFTFVLGSALAAVAGVFVGLYQHQIDPLMGINAGLKAFTAAVVGGIGNLAGAVLGGFLMGLSETYIAGSKFTDYRDAFAFGLLILILLIRPGGLLGSVAAEKV
ncbi:MAG: branched-chain amino acid ABC transporter permease [Planctomycetota bacterium]